MDACMHELGRQEDKHTGRASRQTGISAHTQAYTYVRLTLVAVEHLRHQTLALSTAAAAAAVLRIYDADMTPMMTMMFIR